MRPEKLDPGSIAEQLENLAAWRLSQDGDAISKQFVFVNFRAAFGFMAEVALAAEKLDHHPEWSNVYRQVDVRLTTHSAGGLTELDFKLAHYMDEAAGTN
ncbi:4a-hydroxytetrahydrobiopterin dehydratase [Peteryoungia desertarenae]|uniref:Putative pterin-4-alpha-carbinolamine dehydratase n=1 Tax=Peteryoungia desertarenae TaxID=1813451 RepID=A0ABX6QJI6_9HYPH|nr:4a-hydroxytetrahydrobiopterin dehydratase [Peteryoungia desertarenae]QLF68690.1 4a-hydroxytetrahydrobiopterin dehydratase [Peteryoungia desertarenae]